MDNNIFIALSKYPYKWNNNPRENQITVSFCYLLNDQHNLLNDILNVILKESKYQVKYIASEDYEEISPFVNEYLKNRTVRPDIKVVTKNKKLTLYIENKIDAQEGKYPEEDEDESSQLKRYLDLIKSSSGTKGLIYLTKNYEDLDPKIVDDPNFIGQYTWHQISDVIERYTLKNKLPKDHLTCQFLKYLEANDLKSKKGYEKDYSNSWHDYNEFKEISKEYLDQIMEYFKNSYEGYRFKKPKCENQSYLFNIYKHSCPK